mmetsp:Transcript_5052/g.16215  ORF Transcript_5052/g.16215 Transcript_5052/m.16215 type:complete len:358 (-) Transcript_5052:85-1158(-)
MYTRPPFPRQGLSSSPSSRLLLQRAAPLSCVADRLAQFEVKKLQSRLGRPHRRPRARDKLRQRLQPCPQVKVGEEGGGKARAGRLDDDAVVRRLELAVRPVLDLVAGVDDEAAVARRHRQPACLRVLHLEPRLAVRREDGQAAPVRVRAGAQRAGVHVDKALGRHVSELLGHVERLARQLEPLGLAEADRSKEELIETAVQPAQSGGVRAQHPLVLGQRIFRRPVERRPGERVVGGEDKARVEDAVIGQHEPLLGVSRAALRVQGLATRPEVPDVERPVERHGRLDGRGLLKKQPRLLKLPVNELLRDAVIRDVEEAVRAERGAHGARGRVEAPGQVDERHSVERGVERSGALNALR